MHATLFKACPRQRACARSRRKLFPPSFVLRLRELRKKFDVQMVGVSLVEANAGYEFDAWIIEYGRTYRKR
jgi:hypothetical protein